MGCCSLHFASSSLLLDDGVEMIHKALISGDSRTVEIACDILASISVTAEKKLQSYLPLFWNSITDIIRTHEVHKLITV